MKQDNNYGFRQKTHLALWVIVILGFYTFNKVDKKPPKINQEKNKSAQASNPILEKEPQRIPSSISTKKNKTQKVKQPTLKPLSVKDLRKTMNTSELKAVLRKRMFPQHMASLYDLDVLSFKEAVYRKSQFQVDAYKIQVEIKRKSDGAINNFQVWYDKKNQVILETFGKNKIEYQRAHRFTHPSLEQ